MSPFRPHTLYFDYAASTPVDPRVERAMRPYFLSAFGNPGSLHSFGQAAIAAVDRSRETVARALGADFREIIFTGSATEANNLFLRGAVAAYRAHRVADERSADTALIPRDAPARIIISAIEHESVLETARELEKTGVELIVLPVDKEGYVDQRALEHALTPETALVSIMYANNEIGTVQPIFKIAGTIKKFRERSGTARGGTYPLFHTDAAQAFQFLACRPAELGIDAMTLSAHKLYGPKGIGALYLKSRISLEPLITGGGQEFGLRSGTENAPLIVGFANAVELAETERAATDARIRALAARLYKGIKKIFPRAQLNGVSMLRPAAERLPNILNIHLPGMPAADAVMEADLNGIAIASGSACASRSLAPSHVVRALGYGARRAQESVRISLGRPTAAAEAAALLAVFKKLR